MTVRRQPWWTRMWGWLRHERSTSMISNPELSKMTAQQQELRRELHLLEKRQQVMQRRKNSKKVKRVET